MVRPEHVIYPQFGWLNDAIGGGHYWESSSSARLVELDGGDRYGYNPSPFCYCSAGNTGEGGIPRKGKVGS